LLGALVNIYGREGFINVILCLQLELAPTSTHQNRCIVCVEREIATNTFHCIPVPKLTTVVSYIYQPSTCIVLIITKWYLWFFWGDFVNFFLKRNNILSLDSLFWGPSRGGEEIAKTKILKKNNHHCYHCLQYERVLKNFYFHILNLVKFG
jgi:hypothetical protein